MQKKKTFTHPKKSKTDKITRTLEQQDQDEDKTSTLKYIPILITHIPAHTPKQT